MNLKSNNSCLMGLVRGLAVSAGVLCAGGALAQVSPAKKSSIHGSGTPTEVRYCLAKVESSGPSKDLQVTSDQESCRDSLVPSNRSSEEQVSMSDRRRGPRD
jgi:hypothetical protein